MTFEAFYRLHYLSFVRLVTLLTSSNVDSEDLVQEAFTSISGRFNDLESPVAYLRTTVTNLVRRRYRDEAKRRSRLTLRRPEDVRPDPHARVELAEIIATLPFRQRVVIVGRYWAGWSEEETAQVLGCRPGTVKSLRSRAVKTLRHHIEETER